MSTTCPSPVEETASTEYQLAPDDADDVILEDVKPPEPTPSSPKILVPLVPPAGGSVVIVQGNGQTSLKSDQFHGTTLPGINVTKDRMKQTPPSQTLPGPRRLIFVPAKPNVPGPVVGPQAGVATSLGAEEKFGPEIWIDDASDGQTSSGSCPTEKGQSKNHNGLTPIPPKPIHGVGSVSGQGCSVFSTGLNVLVRLKDNLFYYGRIKKVDEYHKRCRVTFDDDVEDVWASFKDIKIGPSSTLAPNSEPRRCCSCQRETSHPDDQLLVCISCDSSFHQNCHVPNVISKTPLSTWKCHKCCSSILTSNSSPRRISQVPIPLTPGTLKPPPLKSPGNSPETSCLPQFPQGTTLLKFPQNVQDEDADGGAGDVVEIEDDDDIPLPTQSYSAILANQPDLPLKRQPTYSSGKEREPRSFSYNVANLKWDPRHQENEQKMYCYCGKFGDWYDKMLQCWRCGQWFHEGCVQVLQYPLLYGDRFYLFVCSVCNHGLEYVRRLDLNWCTIVHLVLFNLSQSRMRKYYDLDSEIMPFLNEHWDCLQLHHLSDTQPRERYDRVKSELYLHKDVFACGREIKKRTTLWGLRTRIPPFVSPYWIPEPSAKIDDDSLKTLALAGSDSTEKDSKDSKASGDPDGAVPSFHADPFDRAQLDHVIDVDDDDDDDESDGNISGDDVDVKRDRKRKRPMGCQAVGKGVLAQFFCPKRRRRIVKKEKAALLGNGPAGTFCQMKLASIVRHQKMKKDKGRVFVKAGNGKDVVIPANYATSSAVPSHSSTEVGMMPVMAMPSGILTASNGFNTPMLSSDAASSRTFATGNGISGRSSQHPVQPRPTNSIYLPTVAAFNASAGASHVVVSPFGSQTSRGVANGGNGPQSFLIPVSALQHLQQRQQFQQQRQSTPPPHQLSSTTMADGAHAANGATTDEKPCLTTTLGTPANATVPNPVTKPFFIMSPSGQIFAVTGQVQPGQSPSVTPAPTYTQYAPSPVYSNPPPLSPQYPPSDSLGNAGDSQQPLASSRSSGTRIMETATSQSFGHAPSLAPQDSSRGVQSSSSSTAPQTPCETPTNSSSSSERGSPFTEMPPIPVPIKLKKSKRKKQKSKKKKEKYRLHSGHLEVVWKKQRQPHDRSCRDDGCTGFSSKSRKRRLLETRHERHANADQRFGAGATSDWDVDDVDRSNSVVQRKVKRPRSPDSDVVLDDGASDVIHLDDASRDGSVVVVSSHSSPTSQTPSSSRDLSASDAPISFSSNAYRLAKTTFSATVEPVVVRAKPRSLGSWVESEEEATSETPPPRNAILARLSSDGSVSSGTSTPKSRSSEPTSEASASFQRSAKFGNGVFDVLGLFSSTKTTESTTVLKKAVEGHLRAEVDRDDGRPRRQVLGRRTTPDGKTHYLVNFE